MNDIKTDSNIMWLNIGIFFAFAFMAGVFNDINPKIMQYLGVLFFVVIWGIFLFNIKDIAKDIAKFFNR